MDWSGRVPKCGNGVMRSLLFEAETTLLARVQKFMPLKSWAVRLAGRRGFAMVAVAAARKLTVLMFVNKHAILALKQIWCSAIR